MSLIQYPVDRGKLLVHHTFFAFAHNHVSAASIRDGIFVLVSWSLQLVIVILPSLFVSLSVHILSTSA